MKDNVLYSTIRQEPANKPTGDYSISGLYNYVTKPLAIFAIVSLFLAQFHASDMANSLEEAAKGNNACRLYLMLIVLTILAGARAIQSVQLAKRDYLHIPTGISDLIYFALILLFCSGILLVKLNKYPAWTIGIYGVIACVGLWNFVDLYARRIPRRQAQYDYPIERRIQGTNSLVFAFLVFSLGVAFYFTLKNVSDMTVVFWLIGLNYLSTIYNMIHSYNLTMRPKFLYHNSPDSPKSLITLFKDRFCIYSPYQNDDEISEKVLTLAVTKYKEIKTERATRQDVPLICDTLLKEFQYIFAHIFSTEDHQTLRKILKTMLTVGGGFGNFGYTHYYFIVTNKPGVEHKKVGLFKVDVRYPNWIYSGVDLLLLLPHFFFRFYFKLSTILKQAKAIMRTQPAPDEGEIRLTYFVIFPEFRNLGYGTGFMQMLKGAIRNNTNDVTADKISLYVRETNLPARQLFSRAGFTSFIPPLQENVSDPLANRKDIGNLLFLGWNVTV